MSHPLGRRNVMISNVLATMLSASVKLRGVLTVVRAHEYCWHGGDPQINVYVPGSMALHASHAKMSQVHVASHFLSMSMEST